MPRNQGGQDEKVKMAALAVSYGDLCELRALVAPPQSVKELLLAVQLLLGQPVHKATDWVRRLRLLKTSKQHGLIQQVLEREVHQVGLEAALKAKEAIAPLSMEIIRNANMASASLFLWASAMIEAVERQSEDEN